MALAKLQREFIETIANDAQQTINGELEGMVQVFMVVRCYSCKTFQVHQVKKTNKWLCKICNEKQSVMKVYGKGAAKDCRKHVQKLNMLRGEKEREESTGKQHPPQDYADTFTSRDSSSQPELLNPVEHPVVLANTRKSKWTAFTEPRIEDEDNEEIECTTEKERFSQADKPRKQVRRSLSDIRRPQVQTCDQSENICPYSSVNQQMETRLDDNLDSKSLYSPRPPDRYTKLDGPCFLYNSEQGSAHSLSLSDLSSTSPGSSVNHKERMVQIKQDLQQFSNESEQSRRNERTIPQVSSRWSQFMCEDDSGSEGEEGTSSLFSCGGEQELNDGSRGSHTTHILSSKSTISKFTLIQDH